MSFEVKEDEAVGGGEGVLCEEGGGGEEGVGVAIFRLVENAQW